MTDSPHTGPVFDGAPDARPPGVRVFMSRKTTEAARAGVTMGSALAITISWSANKSILWAILHGFLSWLYVIYYAIKYR